MSRFIKTVRKLDSFYKPKCFAHLYFPFASKDEIKCDCISKCKYGPPPASFSNFLNINYIDNSGMIPSYTIEEIIYEEKKVA